MSVYRLPSGKWRAMVWDPRTGRNVSVSKVIPGMSGSFAKKADAKAAREEARRYLKGREYGERQTLKEFARTWTTDPLYQRPKESTNIHNAERIKKFVEKYGSMPIAAIDDRVVAEWIAGAKNLSTIPALKTMFNDAQSAKAGRLIDRNPFVGLGLEKTKGNKEKDPPTEETVWALIREAWDVSPYFGAWLQVAAFTGLRPGELDALRWENVSFEESRIYVVEQFNSTTRNFTLPKNGKKRKAPLTEHARNALLSIPRQSEYCFINLRGNHFTPSSRAYHWNAIRRGVGYKDSLYLATRHFAGWYMRNVLGLDSEDTAVALGHTDGGYQVRTLYGHLDKDKALDRVVDTYQGRSNVQPLRAVEDAS